MSNPPNTNGARIQTPEHKRLEDARTGAAPWKAWGPYLSERQWGTVREDYSQDGDAWNYFPHEQARSRAYRWGEDGIAGVCDERQRLCLALALWNGADPILKERMFGLNNSEGNHGEDVKEYWFYLDSTPTHSYMKCQYKYPQRAFPYEDLLSTNGSRGKQEMEYELLDTGIFDEDRYFDVVVEYAKAGPEDILMLVTAHNRGPDAATLHLLPTLWFRNTWSWGDDVPKPTLDGRRRGAGSRRRSCFSPRAGRVAAARRRLGAAAVLRERDQQRAPVRGTERFAVRQGRDQRVRRRRRCRCGQPGTDGYQGRGPSRAVDRGGRQRLDSCAPDRVRRLCDGRAGQGQAAGRGVRSRVQNAAQGGRPVLRDGHPADAATRRGDGDAPGAGRAAVGQAVLRVQRAPLAARARRRPVGPERACQLGPQRAVVSHGRGRRDLDAGQVGVSVVRRVGSRVSLRAAVAGRRRLRQGSRSSCC